MANAERDDVLDLDLDGGRQLAWRTMGNGSPLVLINGYAGAAADWDPTFLGCLAESFRVICPDACGMGESTWGDPGEPLSIDSMARDVERVLDALGIERVAVLGWSMGGFVAQQLALRSPARVAALVLASTDPGGPQAVRAAPEVWARLIDDSGTPRAQATRLLSLLFPSPLAEQIDREFGDDVAAARAKLLPEVLRAQESAMDSWHAEEPMVPGPESRPALAVCGTEDIVIPPQNSDLLAERWPGCQVERFEGDGHAFMAQEPERLAALVQAFVDSTGT